MSNTDIDCDSRRDPPQAKRSIWQAFRHAWHEREQETRPVQQSNIDFLPAALEILEKPPSPVGRLLGHSVIALFAIFIAWACIGEVDVVASAEGKIIPSARVKQIQPLQVGVIKNIFVEEGQLVEAGQALIEMDQTVTGADFQRLQQEQHFYRLSLLREQVLHKLLSAEDRGQQVSLTQLNTLTRQHLQTLSSASTIFLKEKDQAVQLAIIKQKWMEYSSQRDIVLSQLKNRQFELQSIEANISKYQQTLPLISKRVNALATLNKDGLIAEAQLLELKEAQVGQQQSLVAEHARREQLLAAISEVQQQVVVQSSEARKRNLEQIENLQQQVDLSTQEYTKAGDLYAKQILYSPVRGRVQQLAVHTIGGVVKEAQALMQVVPEERFLEVEAVLQNKDIGFISRGQQAEIKVHTFPFTKYGVIDAKVVGITADAIESEQQGLVYKVRLQMASTQLRVNHKWVDLLPGMAVSAEVKTGKRRLIEFFLSPLLRYKDESVRER